MSLGQRQIRPKLNEGPSLGLWSKTEERADPLYYRLFKSFLRGSYEGSINAPKLNLVDSETIMTNTRRMVEHAAKRGNVVIMGRGSQQFLKDRTDTLRVFLLREPSTAPGF